MSDAEQNLISVKILDRSYKIKCPPEQVEALQEAANYVNAQMQKMRQTVVSVNGNERIAVVTALNICHEFIQLRKQRNNYIDVINQRVQDLQRRIENFMETNKEITVECNSPL